MNGEWQNVREGYITKTVKVGHATLIIHRPILTDEVRALREKEIISAMLPIAAYYAEKEEKTKEAV